MKRIAYPFAALIIAACVSSSNAASLTLEWDAVTTNANSTAITDLAGYRIFSANKSLLAMTTAQAMSDAAVTKTTVGTAPTGMVQNLTAGSTYFFRIAAFDLTGNQSGFNTDSSNQEAEAIAFIAPPAPVPPPPPPPSPVPPPPPGAAAYTIGRVASSINVDGALSEFAAAPAIMMSGAGGNSMQVKMLYDDQNLYIAASVTDAQIDATLTARDSQIYMEDDIEIVIDTLNDGGAGLLADDYKILINPLGAIGDQKGNDGSFNGVFTSAVKVTGTLNNEADTDTGWSAEFAIPFSMLGMAAAAGKIIGMNFMNADKDGTARAAVIWNGAINSANDARDVAFGSGSGSATDLNRDGRTDVSDVQLAINQAVGLQTCGSADVNSDGQCSITDVQRVVNAALGV